jgi:predicted lipoprotein with Yx(FWY)xxD motif
VKQWAFRKKPLYTYSQDPGPGYQEGVDVKGWNIVFTQRAPAPPKNFTYQDTPAGVVLADAKGNAIYVYNCGDDAMDQLSCDHPDTPQQYRYAVCGGGDPIRCARNFPYVVAAKDDKATNKTWTIMEINPKTGKRPNAGTDTLRVWAFRDRPVYTFYADEPGTVKAGAWGEFYGARNGYRAFWIRQEFAGR